LTANGKSRGRGITRLPDFLVVGPPRTGTTWLHGVLYHRACLPERTKETHFFDMFYSKGIDWYRAYFRRCAHEAIAGEVTPTYFSLAHVRERIARDLPGCKIVCTLRDPVARAWSWYRVLHREGRIRADFEDEIRHGNEPQLREANRYAFHLRAWRELFGADNVGVFFYDDLVADPQNFADSLLGFLDLRHVEERHDDTVNHVMDRAVRQDAHQEASPLRSRHLPFPHRQRPEHLFHVFDKTPLADKLRREIREGPAGVPGKEPEYGSGRGGEAPDP